MKVTGYKLQFAIREFTHARTIASEQFDGSIKKFDDEEKPSPDAVVEAFTTAEDAIARIQVAQARYNLAVEVNVQGQAMTLSEAIKRVGGAGRIEKMWRSAASKSKRDFGYRDEDVRNENDVYAKRTISVQEAASRAKKAAKLASALREAIQVGNATEVEIEGLDASLFE